jgi:group I intron endonuclease
MIIYAIWNKKNGQVYIGQTGTTLKQRWKGHVDASKKKSTRFHRAIQFHGKDAFYPTIITECSKKKADELERKTIILFKSYLGGIGYNRTLGGGGRIAGYHHTKEHKERISKALTGRIFTKEHRKNIGLAGIGRRFKLPEYAKRKIGLAHKGKTISIKQRKQISASLRRYFQARVRNGAAEE